MAKKPDPNSPFAVLKPLGKELAAAEEAKARQKSAETAARERAAKAAAQKSPESEAEMFRKAMAGVTSIHAPGEKKRIETRPVGVKPFGEDEDAAVIRELEDIVDGKAALDFSFSDEFVEGRASDCSHVIVSKLKSGEYAVQARLDLHGHNRDEAREAISAFFASCVKHGHRCVIVVSGRGLGSPGGVPVLKELLVRWLVRGTISRYVLAFCSAQPHDGGTGALYVLLRRGAK